MDEGVRVRVATSRAKSKARDQLRALLRDTSLTQTLALGLNEAGEWTMLAGGMTARDVGAALMVASRGVDLILKHEAEQGGAGGKIMLDARVPFDPLMIGRATGRRRKPDITTDAEGELQTPPGEAFSYCAECGASRWYATVRDDGTPGRLACVRCGNEVAMVRVYQEGRA